MPYIVHGHVCNVHTRNEVTHHYVQSFQLVTCTLSICFNRQIRMSVCQFQQTFLWVSLRLAQVWATSLAVRSFTPAAQLRPILSVLQQRCHRWQRASELPSMGLWVICLMVFLSASRIARKRRLGLENGWMDGWVVHLDLKLDMLWRNSPGDVDSKAHHFIR